MQKPIAVIKAHRDDDWSACTVVWLDTCKREYYIQPSYDLPPVYDYRTDINHKSFDSLSEYLLPDLSKEYGILQTLQRPYIDGDLEDPGDNLYDYLGDKLNDIKDAIALGFVKGALGKQFNFYKQGH